MSMMPTVEAPYMAAIEGRMRGLEFRVAELEADNKNLSRELDDFTYSPHFHFEDGEVLFSSATAIERLIQEEVLFVGAGMKVRVLCSDLFYWGCSDSEEIERSDIEELWSAWEAGGHTGINRWCCLRRGLRPQLPIVKRWKERGCWDAELEALPAPEKS